MRERDDTPPWWTMIVPGILFAAAVYGLLWALAILGWVLEALG
jgi:hypothetical protein